ncbi:MAG: hypothetical protein RET84_02550 [Pseudomonadota bacterium]|nr:hypothetical protein [Pseudomonadota bacterium]
MDYALFYRRQIAVDRIAQEVGAFDLFITAFNSSERVRRVLDAVKASTKLVLIHPEYRYTAVDLAAAQLPADARIITPVSTDEVEQINELVSAAGDFAGKSVCIDITGFMRHALSFLVAKLGSIGINNFAVLYSEPLHYVKQEATRFSTQSSGAVRPVRGMYGSPGSGRDHLIIAVGYDHQSVSEVAAHKDGVTVHPLFAFPSLSADMYQQSAIRAERSGEVAVRPEWVSNRFFAPANDPFSTAQVLSERIRQIDAKGPDQNVYISPLSTKVQALGVSLYWYLEGRGRGRTTVLLPECLSYSPETSTGLKRLWKYDVELS